MCSEVGRTQRDGRIDFGVSVLRALRSSAWVRRSRRPKHAAPQNSGHLSLQRDMRKGARLIPIQVRDTELLAYLIQVPCHMYDSGSGGSRECPDLHDTRSAGYEASA